MIRPDGLGANWVWRGGAGGVGEEDDVFVEGVWLKDTGSAPSV